MVGKADLVDRVASRTAAATRAEVVRTVDAVLAEVTAALAAGERVTLTGFGTFEPVGRPARRARNPRTGTTVAVPATTVARFRPGAALRSSVGSIGGGPAAVPDPSPDPASVLVPAAGRDVERGAGAAAETAKKSTAKRSTASTKAAAAGSSKKSKTVDAAGGSKKSKTVDAAGGSTKSKTVDAAGGSTKQKAPDARGSKKSKTPDARGSKKSKTPDARGSKKQRSSSKDGRAAAAEAPPRAGTKKKKAPAGRSGGKRS